MHDRDTSHANPLAAPIEREPSDPEPADPRIIRTQAYADGLAAGRAEAIGPTGGIEDVRHLAAMCGAQGRVDGINEERERCTRAVSTIFARCFAGEPVTVADCDALMNAIRAGKAAP